MKTTFESAAPFLPAHRTLNSLREAAKQCEGCELYKRATQTVFGEGVRNAAMLIVGEQPGDQEDLTGKPFVGPAGKLLDRALADAGIERDDVYVTNAVKHFKWEERGKRRLHAKPSAREVSACHPWLEAEIACVKPKLVVCLGATAAQSMLGREFRLTRQRGEILPGGGAYSIAATVHPSSILRQFDDDSRHRAYAEFVADLKKMKTAAATLIKYDRA